MAGLVSAIHTDPGDKPGDDEIAECREDEGSESLADRSTEWAAAVRVETKDMNNGIAGIDHIIVGVRDLEAARARWQRLGFTLTPRGRHIGQGTANYCIMFPRDYLELLGFVEHDEHAHRLAAFLAHREGAMSVAFAPQTSAEATSAALAALSLHPSVPRGLGRQLELPEGTVVPRFSLLTLPPEETSALDCFICGHLTPELVRRPEWLAHPNGVTGIKAVYVELDHDPLALTAAYRQLFGDSQVEMGVQDLAVDTGRNRLWFRRNALGELLPESQGSGSELHQIVALELSVENRAATAAYLKEAKLACMELPGDRLVVDPAEANGTTLFFS
jgi:catechol 2,3-dioxygenase-like lactoylglutathione lyase family enzyme